MKTFIQMLSCVMAHNQVVVFLVVLAAVSAKIYKKCELAKELKYKYEMDVKQIPVWVCIAKHESDFNTSAVNRGSGDHGLFQISDLYWCDTKRQGRACVAQCKSFEDDDISDDVDCVKTIYEEHERISGDGFDAWVVYPIFCKDKNATYLADCANQDESNFTSRFTNSSFIREENKKIGYQTTLRTTTEFSTVFDKLQQKETSPKRIFTSLGYYILDTTTKRNLIKLKTTTESPPRSTSSRKYTPSTSIFPPISTTVKHPLSNNKSDSHKHFSIVRREEPVKLQSSRYIFQGISPLRYVLGQYNTRGITTPSYRENKTPKFSFLGNRLARKRSQGEIVQDIKLGENYSFRRTKGGGFQLRLI